MKEKAFGYSFQNFPFPGKICFYGGSFSEDYPLLVPLKETAVSFSS